MDAGTLSSFEAFMNFGYGLGYSPYHFSARPRAGQQPKSEADSGSKTESEPEIENGTGEKIWMFNDSRRRRHFLYFLLTLMGLYNIFLVTRTVQAFNDDNIAMTKKLQVFYLTVINIICNLFNVLTISFYGETGKYLNAVLELGHQLKGINVKGQSIFNAFYLSLNQNLCVIGYILICREVRFRQDGFRVGEGQLTQNIFPGNASLHDFQCHRSSCECACETWIHRTHLIPRRGSSVLVNLD